MKFIRIKRAPCNHWWHIIVTVSPFRFYYLTNPLKNCSHDPRKKWWQLFAIRKMRVGRYKNGTVQRWWLYAPWGACFTERFFPL